MIAKHIQLLAVAASCLLAFGAQANDIEPGKEFYTAIKTANPIVLDGDLSEWRGAQLLADPRFSIPKGSGAAGQLVNFEVHNGGSWTGPDDQTSNVRVVYDDDNVYFGFVVTDDYHENAANSAWNGDSVQLMIANETRDSQVALYNYALGGTEEALGGIVILHEAGPGGTEAVIIRDTTTKRTTYEIKLPKESLGLEALTGGVQFGLGMAINDGDLDTPGQKGWGGLGAHALVFGKSPGETALVTLAMANDIEPGKEYYFASPVPGPIVLDGELGDWSGVGVLSDPRFAVPKGSGSRGGGALTLFEVHNGGAWSGPDDQTSAVRIAYDEENVYFGFVVTDDYHENAANSAWNGDSVQLMIANSKQDAQVALYNYALGGTEDALGGVVILHEAGPGGTEAVVNRDSDTKRTTYEIKLPKASMGLEELTLGTMFGLGMAINDGDLDTPGQKGWGGLGAHALVFGKSPSQTALVTLGIGGGGAACFLSAISPPVITALNRFSFRGNDFEGCIVDPAATKLLIDGQPAALVASPKVLGATDFTHTLAATFAPGSEHTFVIELRDTTGNVITERSTFTSPVYVTLTPPMKASNVDTTKPGFKWSVFQNEIYLHTSLDQTELALTGGLVDANGDPVTENLADAQLFGPALGAGTVVGPLVEFEIPTVINLSVTEGGADGNFSPDDQMPGVPGINLSGDGANAQILTYVEFPAGFITMGVNSDDGFRLEAGPPELREMLGEFNGPRGATDTLFVFNVAEAGLYPIRAIWQNGGGGANIEIFTVKADNTKVLLNDIANGGLKAYRSVTSGPSGAFAITKITMDASRNVVLEWSSRTGVSYAIDGSATLAAPWQKVGETVPSGGATTQSVLSAAALTALESTGQLYLRVREL